MKSQAKRLSILSLPDVQEVYSVPTFTDRERDQFFTFTDDELGVVKGLHSHRYRVHFLLMLGYIKVKPVCLVYHWKDVEIDYQYISQRYYPSASKQKQNISRDTRSRLYGRVLGFCGFSLEKSTNSLKPLSSKGFERLFKIHPTLQNV